MQHSKKILVTGGSGMIGHRLTTLLMQRGYEVFHLLRSKKIGSYIKTFIWDPKKKVIEKNALLDADVIIHLAGAGVAEKRWSESHKREILQSRTQSTRLLHETLQREKHHVSTFISASGISFYGLGDPSGDAFIESDAPATDFMAQVTLAWEAQTEKMNELGIRTVKIRTGVVLSRRGGALEKLAQPVKLFLGAPLGSGNQYVNWIHLDDLCAIYIKAIEDQAIRGVYNGVAPNPVTNKELTKQIARALKKPLWLPNVPGLVVKLIAGEVAMVVLKGGKVSSEKIRNTGFDFKFKTVQHALQDLLRV